MTDTPTRRPDGAEWNAAVYHRVSQPHIDWGGRVLARLDLRGDETVLDAGCGTGRLTAEVLERLPRGRVIALDGSPSMIDQARARLGPFGERVVYLVADLLEPIPTGPVDAILSTATFHWIPDHPRLFRNLAAVLRPRGRLVAQCGGEGNIASVRAVVAELLGPVETNVYASPDVTRTCLLQAGFTDVECWLTPEPTELEAGEPFERYLRTVCLGAHLERLPAAERDAFVREVARRLGRPHLDYVRLNILATRA